LIKWNYLMITEHYIELFIGAVGSVGGVLLLLNRFGLLHFGRKTKETILKTCPAHADLKKQLGEVHDNQIKNIQLHENHAKELKEGREEFKTVSSELVNLAIGIAVLLERTGGKSARFKENGD